MKNLFILGFLVFGISYAFSNNRTLDMNAIQTNGISSVKNPTVSFINSKPAQSDQFGKIIVQLSLDKKIYEQAPRFSLSRAFGLINSLKQHPACSFKIEKKKSPYDELSFFELIPNNQKARDYQLSFGDFGKNLDLKYAEDDIGFSYIKGAGNGSFIVANKDKTTDVYIWQDNIIGVYQEAVEALIREQKEEVKAEIAKMEKYQTLASIGTWFIGPIANSAAKLKEHRRMIIKVKMDDMMNVVALNYFFHKNIDMGLLEIADSLFGDEKLYSSTNGCKLTQDQYLELLSNP